jgi:hypothetical protein
MQCFVYEHERALKYPQVWVYPALPPPSEFLWLLSHRVPSTVRRRRDVRVPRGSIHPFAYGFRFARVRVIAMACARKIQ